VVVLLADEDQGPLDQVVDRILTKHLEPWKLE
jgi:hypothetical protein